MEYLASIGILAWVALMAVTVCIIIAPLILWRNTNRANRLLEELLDEVQRSNALLARLQPPQAQDRPQAQDKTQDFELS